MKTIKQLTTTFFETLNEKTYGELIAWFKIEKRSRESQIRYLAPLVGWVLREYEIPAKNLLEIAKAMNISTGRLRSADALAAHIRWAVIEYGKAREAGRPLSDVNTSPDAPTEVEDWDKDYGGFKLSELWTAAEQLAAPIVLLKAKKSKTTTSTALALWNTSLSSKFSPGIWFRVDLSNHPNPQIRTKSVLSVNVDPGTGETSISLAKGGVLEQQKGEKPLYGEEAWEFPAPEVLSAKTSSKTKRAIEKFPLALQDYESQWWADYRPCDAYRDSDVFAQLGGLPFGWPGNYVDLERYNRVVARTYRDAEPWIEVWKARSGFKSESYVS